MLHATSTRTGKHSEHGVAGVGSGIAAARAVEQEPNGVSNLLDFVGELYEASHRPEHWPVALRMLCERIVPASSAAILVDDRVQRRRQILGQHGVPRAVVLAYNLGLARHDPVYRIQERQPVGVASQVADHRELREYHPLYHRLVLKPANLGFVAAVTLYRDDEWHVGLGVHRGFEAEPFSAADIATIQQLFPHFCRAVRIHREFELLRNRDDQLSSALSRLTLGVLVVAPGGRVVYRNETADLLLDGHPAIGLTAEGRLRVWSAEEQRQLDQLLCALATAERRAEVRGRAIGIHHPGRDLPLTLMAAPLEAPLGGMNGTSVEGYVAVYLADPESPTFVQAETLQSLYGLSPAEAAVAISLANGLTLEEISRSNGVSTETVRSQLKSVFSRMGVNRQQDVVRVVLKGMQPLRL